MSLLQPVSEPELNGIAEIRVAETLGARERMARSLLTDTLWRVGLMAVAALLLVWLAVSAALRPLGRLSEAVQERAPDDLRPLPLVSVQRELRPLVVALNGFTERLRGQFERRTLHRRRLPRAAHATGGPQGAHRAGPAQRRSRRPAQHSWRTPGRAPTRSSTCQSAAFLARIESGAQSIAEGGAQRLDLSQLARELGLAMAALAHKRGVALALKPRRRCGSTANRR